MIIFGSIRFGFYKKKNNQTEIKKKKTETGSNRPVLVRFLGQKPVQTGLTRFFQFGSIFWFGFVFFRFGLGLVFSVLNL
jgi:hypothetical protein